MPKRQKLSKAEKLNRDIERWERKQEGATIMLRKSAEELVKLRRQRRRMLKLATAQAVTLHKNGEPLTAGDVPEGATVEFEVGTGKVTAIEATPDIGAPAAEAIGSFTTLGEAAQKVVEAVKPKRQRKAPAGSERAALHHTPPSAKLLAEGREARMKAMGFRPTPRRGK